MGIVRPLPAPERHDSAVEVERLVVIGAGGHGREALSTAIAAREAGHPLELLGVLDDGTPPRDALTALGTVHLGGVDWLGDHRATSFIAALGYPATRRAVSERAELAGGRPTVLLHPSAVIGADVELSPGVAVFAQVAVTTRVRIGRHTHLNTACSVSHDADLGDFVTIGPGARICGTVRLADDVWVGAGATIIEGVSIGPRTVVGAGAVVLRDVGPDMVVAGVPARPLSSRPRGEPPFACRPRMSNG